MQIRLSKWFFLTVALFLFGCVNNASVISPTSSASNTQPIIETPQLQALRAFAKCDASFFNLLKEQPSIFGEGVKIAGRGKVATIVVNDPLQEKGRQQKFLEPLKIGNLSLHTWRNDVSYDNRLGAFVNWTFQAEGKIDAVANELNRLLPSELRVKKVDTELWARGEHRLIGDPIDKWRKESRHGLATPKGMVERVLMVEPAFVTNTVLITCTMQGSVTSGLLEHYRPDLLPREHP